jgi:glycosyltransferase involved in cell wall biosynthesis
LWAEFDCLQRQIRRIGPDIIHVFNYPAIYFGIPAGVEAGVRVRVAAIQAQDTWKGWMERITDRLIRAGVTSYLVDGEGSRRFAIKDQGLDPKRVTLLYDGPDMQGLVSSSSKEKARQGLGLKLDGPAIGLVGRLQDSHKGQSIFLRSIARLTEDLRAQFAIVGGGEDEPMLRGLAEELGLKDRVVFTGPRPQLADVLNALDILVIPSLRYESVPKILLEGLAVGCAVVASRMGDIPEFLEDGVTGLLVEPGDPGSLAAAIHQLLVHPDEARCLGRRARASLIARGLTLRESLETLSDLYTDLAKLQAHSTGPLLRARMRQALALYRVLWLGDQRVRWLFGQPPRQRRYLSHVQDPDLPLGEPTAKRHRSRLDGAQRRKAFYLHVGKAGTTLPAFGEAGSAIGLSGMSRLAGLSSHGEWPRLFPVRGKVSCGRGRTDHDDRWVAKAVD